MDRSALTDPLPGWLDAPAGWAALDPVSDRIRGVVAALPLPPGLRDALHGLWLGHPLHPALAQVPLGCWLSAAVLDLTGAPTPAVRRLTALGLAAAPPTLLAGWVDWADLPPAHRRTGLVHALGAAAATGLHAAALWARCRGHDRAGRRLALTGLGLVTAAATLGAHLTYRQGAGAAHAEAVPRVAPPGWHQVGAVDEFPRDRPVRRELGEVPVVVVRGAEGFDVLADRCTHMAGSLSDGRVEDGCVRCPLHGSRFRLADGKPVRGPATAAQPRFDTRVLSDRLEVRAVAG
ncbi:Rieske 2Fe-2S domain-containing protein [Kitasatospora sp. NPDC048365]|uniref:Rieske 2Fe-2S domain-containing protein n=1 Tax=Kitasatospora sp. NPDC048365 TaxID=3364050 RepID=UPI00371CA3FB